MNSERSSALCLALDLAREVGAILLEWRGSAEVDTKSDGTLVTQADIEADRYIYSRIRTDFHEDAVLSEELNPVCSGRRTSAAVWVIDPLDGTTNYSRGLPLWGVSIARLLRGQLDLGVIYFPVLGELYHATRGGGAFVNGERILVSDRDVMEANHLFSCCSRTLQYYELRTKCKTRVMGSATYGLCAIARGNALAGMESVPKIWDLAASWLIVQEAGGFVHTLDGSQPFPLTFGMDYAGMSFPVLAAASEELWKMARASIRSRQ